MVTRLVRTMAWLYAVVLIFLTLGPPSVRLEAEMFHDLEHLAAFGVSGLLFSIGYQSRRLLVLLAGVGFTAVLEALQMWVPGRHARWIDLAMNGAGFCIGVGVPFAVSRSVSHLARPSRAVSDSPKEKPGLGEVGRPPTFRSLVRDLVRQSVAQSWRRSASSSS
jgi:VanZ family protein